VSRKIAVIGLGYVGLPVALAFARRFPGTIGFDINHRRVEALRNGQDDTLEVDPEELASSSILFTADPTALQEADFFVVAVPTPIDEEKRPDLRALTSASQTVGKAMSRGAIVVYESTVYPGVTEDICGPILEQCSGLEAGRDFFLGYSPERINPGDREHTLENVVKIVSAQTEAALDVVSEMYGGIVNVGVYRAPSIKVAEAAKVIENTQRDLNIALMNELALIFDRMHLSTKDVLDAAGTKWNFLKFYPGLVGGHCIGVDPYYLTTKAEQLGYKPEVILAGRRINDEMGANIARRAVKLMINAGSRVKGARVGILGITFKENVPDIRNSRIPGIISELNDFGIHPLIHDPMASSAEVREEYGLELSAWDDFRDLEVLIYAVSHDWYSERKPGELFGMLGERGVFIDIKSVIPRTSVPEHLVYWQL
jgi:UDP-N-acetyl-D-galactosamine dehydrogenase